MRLLIILALLFLPGLARAQISAYIFNDTNAALSANQTFTGASHTVPLAGAPLPFRYYYVSAYSDQSSAANGFQILCLIGANYTEVAETTLQGGAASILQVPFIYSSCEVSFTNGATNQTTFRVQSGFAP